VVCPTQVPEFDASLRLKIEKGTFETPSVNMTQQDQTIHDPFSVIPDDVMHMILSLLPAESIMAVRVVSEAIHNFTSRNEFWKWLMKWEMPWLWELADISSPTTNFKILYSWLDQKTKGYSGMKGPFMGIANRRRIWSTCEEIADKYHARLRETRIANASGGLEDFLEYAECLQMPRVLHPLPNETSAIIKSLWAHSWADIASRTANFESFWDSNGVLVGLGVCFGNDRRTFGRTDGDSSAAGPITMQSIRIFKTDWIRGFVLHIPEIDMCDEAATTAIKGITVSTMAYWIGQFPRMRECVQFDSHSYTFLGRIS
jgi:hypothetical protein